MKTTKKYKIWHKDIVKKLKIINKCLKNPKRNGDEIRGEQLIENISHLGPFPSRPIPFAALVLLLSDISLLRNYNSVSYTHPIMEIICVICLTKHKHSMKLRSKFQSENRDQETNTLLSHLQWNQPAMKLVETSDKVSGLPGKIVSSA